MSKLTTVYFQGVIEHSPYGIPFQWKSGNLFSMNLFLAYLIQNQFAITDKWKEKENSDREFNFIKTLQKIDEFEVLNFFNLELFDTSNINFERLILRKCTHEIIAQFGNANLVFSEGHNLSFTHDNIEIPLDELVYFKQKIIGINIDSESRLVFMNRKQIKNNINYVSNLINEIFQPLNIHLNSTLQEISQIFKVD